MFATNVGKTTNAGREFFGFPEMDLVLQIRYPRSSASICGPNYSFSGDG
jgi:hypothetical protein